MKCVVKKEYIIHTPSFQDLKIWYDDSIASRLIPYTAKASLVERDRSTYRQRLSRHQSQNRSSLEASVLSVLPHQVRESRSQSWAFAGSTKVNQSIPCWEVLVSNAPASSSFSTRDNWLTRACFLAFPVRFRSPHAPLPLIPRGG